MRKKLALWLPLGIWCGVIFFLSSIPSYGDSDDLLRWFFSKMAHVVEYAVLGRLVQRAWDGSFAKKDGKAWVAALIFSAAYAMSDEYHQSFVVGRHCSGYDVLLDSLAAFLGLCLAPFAKLRGPAGTPAPSTEFRVPVGTPEEPSVLGAYRKRTV